MPASFQRRVRLGTPLRGDPLKTAGKHTGAVTQFCAAAYPCRKKGSSNNKDKNGCNRRDWRIPGQGDCGPGNSKGERSRGDTWNVSGCEHQSLALNFLDEYQFNYNLYACIY